MRKIDNIYSFVMKGELTKSSLTKTKILKKHETSESFNKDIFNKLPFDLLEEDYVLPAKNMATVYAAIMAFENYTRKFIEDVLIENYGDKWWDDHVSEKIRSRAGIRKQEEDKIKWHSQRGYNVINYTDMSDLVSIIQQNYQCFEPYIVSFEWAKQVLQTIERSRNVIMHSGELGIQDIERISMNMRDWINQIGA